MLAFISKASEEIPSESTKIAVFDNRTVLWRPSPGNPRKYPHKPYIVRNYCRWATSPPLIVWVYLHSNFQSGFQKCM